MAGQHDILKFFSNFTNILPCVLNYIGLMLEFASRKLTFSNDSDLGTQVILESFNND